MTGTGRADGDAERAQLAAIVASSGDAILSLSTDGVIETWNNGAATLYGYSAEQAIGQLAPTFLAKDPNRCRTMLASVTAAGGPVRTECEHVRSDRTLIEVAVVDAPILDAGGQVVGIARVVRNVTEHRRLDGLAGHLKAVVESSADAIISKSLDGTILTWNLGAEALYGYSKAEAIGQPISLLAPRGHEGEVAQLLACVGRGESVDRFDTVRRCKDGSLVDVALTLSAVRNGNGQIIGVSTIVRDITEQKRSAAAVNAARADIDRFFGLSLDIMAIANDQGHFVRVNPAFERILGYSAQELTAVPFRDFIHPDDLESTLAQYAELLAGASMIGFEDRFRCKNGSYRWLLWNASAAEDGFVYCTAVDVTERRRMVEELRTSERRLALAQRAGRVGTWDWNVATQAIYWSEEMEEIYGLVPGGFGGLYEAWSLMVHPEDLPSAEAGLRNTVETQTDWQQDLRIIRADGAERWIAASAQPYVDDAGECHVVGVNLDVTERKLAERQLIDAARFFEVTSDMVCTASFDGFFKALNGSWMQTLGWSAEELLSRPYIDFVHPDDRPDTSVDLGMAVSGQSKAKFTNRYRTKDGRWRWLEWNSTTIHEEALIYASARDVTVRVEAEAAIVAAEAAAAKARDEALEASALKSAFLANMSHEVRTPLNGVIGMADLLLDGTLDPEQSEYARLLRGAGETLVAVVDDILDFSKIEAGAMRLESVDIDLLETVEDACDLLADSAQRSGVELTLDLDPELPQIVRGDAVRLRQIVGNLLSNAVKFTAHGEVRVTLRVLGVPTGTTNVRFAVMDTGIGIDADRLGQMFEPFIQEDDSTTRRFGGTGLGLAIVKQLVEMMDGEVGVTSVRGQGSTFWFTLPFELGDAPPQQWLDGPPAGTRLLVVDDNETNRRLLVQLAGRWGLPVTAVPGAAEALTELRESAGRGEPFECVALDMHMPGTDGLELALAIQRDESFPTPALVMLTSTSDQRREAREAGIDVHLTKPVRRSRLQRALAEALGTQAGRLEPTVQPELGGNSGSAPLVLIVEDNDINQILAVRMLERRGYRTDVAGDGRQALVKLEERAYAAVLMDCQMPELNGYDTTRELRDREAGRPSTPVIAMTANALRGDREKCLASGMDDYLPKPLKPEDLERAMKRWAPRPGAMSDPDRPEDPMAPNASLLDPAGIEVFLAETGEAARTVVGIFGTQTPLLLEQMRAAIVASDTASLRETAHKLRGSCLTVAAGQMGAHCMRLESRAREGMIEGSSVLVDQLAATFAVTYDALIAKTRPS